MLVTRDRADQHPTEISYIYTFFAHVMHPCTGSSCCIHGRDALLYHTQT